MKTIIVGPRCNHISLWVLNQFSRVPTINVFSNDYKKKITMLKAVVVLWFSVACFGVRVSVTCSYYF